MTRPGERAPPSSPACRAAERLALLRGASQGWLQAARGRCPRLGMFVWGSRPEAGRTHRPRAQWRLCISLREQAVPRRTL